MALASLTPGTLFARDFVVGARIAQGGMGAVYRAEQRSTGNAVALKVMLPGLLVDAKSRERFEHEARVAGRIKSSHVVKVVAAGVDEPSQTPWLAMELVEGQSLAEFVRTRGPLPLEIALTTLQQVGHALAAAHAVGVVHCDLKPENVLIAASQTVGVPFEVKVLDFGIARVIKDGRSSATVTTAIGSPHWLAPEQGAKGRTVSPATDVWSLGLLAFWMLTGRFYWRKANVAEAELNLYALLGEIAGEDVLVPASERLRALGEGRAMLPRGFDGWFAQCVNREVDARYVNAGVAIEALAAALRSSTEPTAITRTSLPSVPAGVAFPATVPVAGGGPRGVSTSAPTEVLPQGRASLSGGGLRWQIAAVAGAALVMGFALMAAALVRKNKVTPTTAAPAAAVPVTVVAHTSEVESAPTPRVEAAAAPTATPARARPAVARPVAMPSPAFGDGQASARESVVRGNSGLGSGDSTGGEGQIDANAVARIIRGQLGGIRACYERELAHNRTLAGRLEMNFTIGSNGRITSISAGGPLASSSPPVGSCVSARLRGLVFPAPEGGSVEFSFPFTFSPSS